MKSYFARLVLSALLAVGSFHAHPQGKISADATAAALSGGEFLAGVQGGFNVKVLPSQILAYARGNLYAVNAQTGTTYTYVAGDIGKLVTHSNASPIAAALPQATGSFGSGWFALVQNRGSGTLTLTPATSTIDGAASLALTTGQGITVVSDGTNYYTLRGVGGVGGGTVTVAQGGTGLTTLTANNVILGNGTSTPSFVAPGTSGYVLTSNGTTWTSAAAAGGGGLTNLTEAVSTASPNATVPVVSLTATNAASNVDAALLPKGTGGLAVAIADSTSTGGNKRGNYSVDLQMQRTTAAQVTSGANSTIGGGKRNTASAAEVTIAGGSTNQATFFGGSIGGGFSNTVQTANYGTIAGGNQNTVSGIYGSIGGGSLNAVTTITGGTVAGGQSNTASATGATVGGGDTNAASGQYSTIPGGRNNLASGSYSFVVGSVATDRGIQGAFAQSSRVTSTSGEHQGMLLQLAISTSDATPKSLMSSNSGVAGAGNQLSLPVSSAYIVKGLVVARQNTTGDSASWEFVAHIKRASGGTTSMVAACTPTVVAADSGASTWTLAVTADNTNGALSIVGTGEASKTIRWTAYITSAQAVN